MTTELYGKATVVGPDRREEWNSFVARDPHGHFMQLWESGESRQATRWRPHYVAVEGEHGLKATALILERKIPGLGSVFYSPAGPLWSPSAGEHLSSLIAAVRALGRTRRAFLWRVDPYVLEREAALTAQLELTGFRAVDMSWSYWNQPKYVMLLPLEGGKAAVLNGIDGRDRYKIRYPSKQGVEVKRVPVDENTIGDLHRLMTQTARKKGLLVHDASWYAQFLRTFGAAGYASLFLARRGGETVSAGVSMRMGARAWLMYLGSDYSAPRSSWALQWEMVSWAIDMGCSCYDFRGPATNYPPRPDDKGYGVYRFKKSFGAEIETLVGYYDLVLEPARYRMLRWAERRLLPMGEHLLDLRARFLKRQ